MENLNLHRTGMISGTMAAISPNPLPSGKKSSPLAGRYHLEAPLGHGTASIFRAKDLKTGTHHAIKRLPRDTALEPGEHERFVSEVTLLSQLCHPNIVAMTALHRDATERSCLVMELLEGEDALTHLAGGQRLSLPRVLEITRQVTSALRAAHLAGIFHREFQLSSIFLAMQRGLDGTPVEVVKVVGFGGVKVRHLSGQPARTGLLGTAEYMAPEGVLGPRSELDACSDQWSVAVTVYRMLSGRLPFRTDDEASLQSQICTSPPFPLSELCPELPDHVLLTVGRALSKDKEQRFPSMAEFMRALRGQQSALASMRAPQTAESASSVTAQCSEGLLTRSRAPRREPPQSASGLFTPHPISMSDIPTVAIKVGLDQTLNIDPALLEKLRTQSQVPEQASFKRSEQLKTAARTRLPIAATPPHAALTPPLSLPGSWLMREHRQRVQRRHSLVLILGSCVGLSLGMTAAWLLGPNATKHLHRSRHPVVEPKTHAQSGAVAISASPASSVDPSTYRPGPGAGTYRVCVQPSGPMDILWNGSCRTWR